MGRAVIGRARTPQNGVGHRAGPAQAMQADLPRAATEPGNGGGGSGAAETGRRSRDGVGARVKVTMLPGAELGPGLDRDRADMQRSAMAPAPASAIGPDAAPAAAMGADEPTQPAFDVGRQALAHLANGGLARAMTGFTHHAAARGTTATATGRYSRQISTPPPEPPGTTRMGSMAPVRQSAAPAQTEKALLPSLDSQTWQQQRAASQTATGPGALATATGTSPEGPTQGDVYLDGSLMGRWMARTLAAAAGRPSSGGTAFDPTRSAFPSGAMIGG